ncbi:MAG: preprotein translocase subunit SecE [Solirubrobacterales bacterium]|jgi:preprotein translocase SecE subunit|nr:preprotein translocase subunit SecE [Solirubrobacterales bacterium]
MAKTRAQRKAERRAREAEERKRSAEGRDSTARAQHDTQVPKSGDEAIIEAEELGMAAGVPEEALALPEQTKPSRSERRAEVRAQKEAEKRQRNEQKRRETQLLEKKQKQAKAERAQRGGVIGFLLSCWAELKKVQWPDRETLIQATAVTIIFVAVAAAFLGALDALFNEIVKQIL